MASGRYRLVKPAVLEMTVHAVAPVAPDAAGVAGLLGIDPADVVGVATRPVGGGACGCSVALAARLHRRPAFPWIFDTAVGRRPARVVVQGYRAAPASSPSAQGDTVTLGLGGCARFAQGSAGPDSQLWLLFRRYGEVRNVSVEAGSGATAVIVRFSHPAGASRLVRASTGAFLVDNSEPGAGVDVGPVVPGRAAWAGRRRKRPRRGRGREWEGQDPGSEPDAEDSTEAFDSEDPVVVDLATCDPASPHTGSSSTTRSAPASDCADFPELWSEDASDTQGEATALPSPAGVSPMRPTAPVFVPRCVPSPLALQELITEPEEELMPGCSPRGGLRGRAPPGSGRVAVHAALVPPKAPPRRGGGLGVCAVMPKAPPPSVRPITQVCVPGQELPAIIRDGVVFGVPGLAARLGAAVGAKTASSPGSSTPTAPETNLNPATPCFTPGRAWGLSPSSPAPTTPPMGPAWGSMVFPTQITSLSPSARPNLASFSPPVAALSPVSDPYGRTWTSAVDLAEALRQAAPLSYED